MNIRKFYEKLEAKHDQEQADRLSRKQEIEEKTSPLREERAVLIADRDKMQSRLEPIKKEGLPHPELEEELKKVDLDIHGIDAKLSHWEHEWEKVDKLPDIPWIDSSEAEDMCSVLEEAYGCSEALEINDIGQCVASLPVLWGATNSDCDDFGRPSRCSVLIGNEGGEEIKIRPGKRFAKNFIPESLNWLPMSFDNEDSEPDTEGL